MADRATSKSGEPYNGMKDVLMTTLRGVIQPVFDSYRHVPLRTAQLGIPAWAVSDQRNMPVPYIVEHQYDFGHGGVYGPPDMPVKAGIANMPRTVHIQPMPGIDRFEKLQDGKQIQEFNNKPQDNMEIFVYSPFALHTDLPCSTSALKY